MATVQKSSLLRPLVEDLEARRAQIKLGGGEEKIARQHAQEKLTARERLALLIDEGTFTELGIHGRPHSSQRAMEGRQAPAEVVMSGVIPQVAALMGPCAAGTAYIPGLADFVPMVKGRGSMALAGPHLVRAAVGEEVTQEELGGSRVHCRKSGVGDLEVPDDE